MNELTLLSESQSAAVVSKSCTLEYRDGNPGKRYHISRTNNTINSTGLANFGFRYYLSDNPIIQSDKPFFLSVAGMTSEDNLTIIKGAEYVLSQGVHNAIELNLSCPNICGKPQMGYDFDASRELLRKIYEQRETQNNVPIGLKLPPYLDPSLVGSMSDIIREFPIGFATCINSVGNGLMIDIDRESTIIHPNNGLGGLGGPNIKPVALANVWMFHRELPNLDIVGCGGITNGDDVFEHILCGASAVQVASILMKEDVNCFDRLKSELLHVMLHKKYNDLQSFRGRLQQRCVSD
jgi:dihydroorotate dehydrogenase (fumarate)